MTPVRMAHPNHGFMYAYTHDEIQNLEALGWVPESKSEPQPDVEAILRHTSADALDARIESKPKRKYTKRQAA